MTLEFHPNLGTILICDFATGFHPPEMVKKRPVVVVSSRDRVNGEVLTVIPLSTAKPAIIHPWHCGIDTSMMPPHFREKETWAKCDMIITVACWRLDRMREKVEGKRVYSAPVINSEDLTAIQQGIKAHLNLT